MPNGPMGALPQSIAGQPAGASEGLNPIVGELLPYIKAYFPSPAEAQPFLTALLAMLHVQ